MDQRVLDCRAQMRLFDGGSIMFTPDLILATMLITGTPGAHEATPTPEQWPLVQFSVQKLATDWQILDGREKHYILAKREEFNIDINLLRRRYQDLRDAPSIEEANRLPDRKTASEMIKFNRTFRQYLVDRQILERDRDAFYQIVLFETDKLYRVWDCVRDAQCDFYYITVRRQALQKLRCLLGEQAYLYGELPPNVPIWRFAETK